MQLNKKLCGHILTALLIPKIIFANSFLITDRLFDSELDAVIAAMNYYNPISLAEKREYMGVVYRDGAGYKISVNAGRQNSDLISIAVDPKTMEDTVAFWHTHGGTSNRFRFFSDTDTETVSRFKLPFYLGDYTGFLKVYRPGDRTLTPFRAQKMGLDYNRGYARGDIILDEFDKPVRVRTNT